MNHEEKIIVLCDLDGIVANLLGEWLKRYNEEYKASLTVDQITHFNIHKCVPIGQEMYKYIRSPGIYSVLEPLPGAIEALKELNNTTDLLILTTPSNAPESATEKIFWCRKYLPFLHRKQIMLAARKDLVYGHYLIDDSPEHLEKWKYAWCNTTLTIDYPYNRGIHVDVRAKDYNDTAKAWAQIVSSIKKDAAFGVD
jgi:5'-nucleotidase